MNDKKPWWQSRTIIGAIILALTQLSSLLAPDTIRAAEIATLVEAAFTLIGLAMVVIGRLRATKKIAS